MDIHTSTRKFCIHLLISQFDRYRKLIMSSLGKITFHLNAVNRTRFNNKTRTLPVINVSPLLNSNLSWMYTRLTDELISPIIRKELKSCRICKYFDDLMDMLNYHCSAEKDAYVHVYIFLESIFSVKLSTTNKINISKLSLVTIKTIVNNVYSSVIYEYQQCICFKKKMNKAVNIKEPITEEKTDTETTERKILRPKTK